MEEDAYHSYHVNHKTITSCKYLIIVIIIRNIKVMTRNWTEINTITLLLIYNQLANAPNVASVKNIVRYRNFFIVLTVTICY